MSSIVEEKIIDGVRTEFRYKRNLLGMKGNLSSKYEYIGNKIIYTSYFENGQISLNEERNLDYQTNGVYKKYERRHPDGIYPSNKNYREEDVVHYLFEICNYKDGIYHGERKYFSIKGHPTSIGNYYNGEPTGTHLKYCYNCGKPHFKGTYSDGIPTGEHIHTDCDGSITEKIIYKDGYNRFDKIIYFEESNQIKSVEGFINGYEKQIGNVSGDKQGHCKYYSYNGEIIQEGNYDSDKKVGNWVVNEDLKNNEDED